MTALADAWPPYGLRLQTPRLVLRLPTEEELAELARRAVANVVSAEQRLFMGPWTQLPAGAFERSMLQFHWSVRGRLTPADWRLELGVFAVEDPRRAIGIMGLTATDFALARTVETGSWLLRDHQGQGLGKQMRTAVLELAFSHLDAREARTSAHPTTTPRSGSRARSATCPTARAPRSSTERRVRCAACCSSASGFARHAPSTSAASSPAGRC